MRILYIITQADGGGAQNYVLNLAGHFNGAIAAGGEDEKLFDKARSLGVETFKLRHLKRDISPLNDLLAIWEIRKLVKTFRPDIAHLNSTKAGILGSFACIGLKTKVVFTAHGFIFHEPMSWPKKSFYITLEKEASRYRDYIITVSDKDRQSALALKLISPQKISTVHNGLGKIDFLPKDEARKNLGLPPHPPLSLEGRGIKGEGEKFIFGTLANFYQTKGLDILIDAVNILPAQIKDKCHFVILGDGQERKNYELRIKNYGLTSNIKLAGNIRNGSIYLKAFDAFILPSRKEGFPYAILEAMQAGLPIIAANVGGIPEALADAGILISPENPKILAQTIKRLFADKNLQKSLAEKAAKRAELFSKEKMILETEKIYQDLTPIF